MLSVENLSVSYGDAPALVDLSLDVSAGEIVSVLGSNGAGKSTLLRALSGLLPLGAGSIRLDDVELTGTKPEERVKKGLVMVPEGRRLFPFMTVRQNILLGGYTVKDQKVLTERYEQALDIFPRLKGKQSQMAGTMSGGEQQMAAIARGLVSAPRILMVDEMSLGLAPILVAEMFDLMLKVRKQGITILLVEQNVEESLDIADRAYILQTGRVVMQGPAAELADSEDVKKAYLGM